MKWKSSFEATGEAIAMRHAGERAMAEEISRVVLQLMAKLSSWLKKHPAAAE